MVLAFSPPSPDDVDGYLATLRSGECLPERALRRLCAAVSELMIEESKKGTAGITKGPRAPTAARAARCGTDAVTLTPARSFKDAQALGETRARVRSVFGIHRFNELGARVLPSS